jgi:hypothetical protein
MDGAVNAVSPYARAVLNVRVHPGQDAEEAQAAVLAHLRAQRPFGIALDARPGATGNGFAAATSGPAYDAARAAWSAAWGREVTTAGGGGSIPLASSLSAAVPEAEMLLVGATDGYANIHGPNERVLVSELEHATVAEADLPRALRRAPPGDMSAAAPAAGAPAGTRPGVQRLLDGIETLGNKMPSPAVLFLVLCVVVILLSQALDWAGVKATSEVAKPPPA